MNPWFWLACACICGALLSLDLQRVFKKWQDDRVLDRLSGALIGFALVCTALGILEIIG